MNHPLQLIQNELSRLNCYSVITFFLKQDQLSEFEIFATRYDELRRDGKLTNILGLAIEGPLLASSGGTPAWASRDCGMLISQHVVSKYNRCREQGRFFGRRFSAFADGRVRLKECSAPM